MGYKFPSADAALAFLKTQELCLFGACNVVPANPEKGYPIYPGSNTPWPHARLYSDELSLNIDTRGIKAPDISILKKYQARLKRALKKENIPVIA